RWDPDRLGLALARLIVTRLLPEGEPLHVAVDDTAHRRRGRKIHGAGWIHDGSAPGRGRLSFGHRWVVLALLVPLPFLTRPVALPVLVRRWKGKGTASVVDLAHAMATAVGAAFPDRTVHVTGDAAYHSKILRGLPPRSTWTTRLPLNAVLYDVAPPPTGRRGRPRTKGDRLGRPADPAATAAWIQHTVHRYGRTDQVDLAQFTCLWYGVFHTRTVHVILVRDRPDKPLLALVTTDLATSAAAELVTRYAGRWAVEVNFFDCRQTLGVGQAHNRTRQAVERTFPFGMYVYSLIVLWYALHGHHPEVVTERRQRAPWYTTKAEPSFLDMLVTLRRTLIAARFLPIDAGQPADHEIRQVQQAWASATA
ncbi:transposase, partial [Streptomyces sp. NPDC090442]|uniref:IS701 family transposase n=1 Tax=Streptomyces sp. NPDC090442 TaxID=3365962 RepID=UPI00382C71B1